MSKNNISPKRNKNNVVIGQSLWYNYYAGYSDGFVYKCLKKYAIQFDNPIILDPWTGSGTTNLVANYLGYENYGFDINPVMIIIAKAKQYNADLINREFISSVLNTENINKCCAVKIDQDYLSTWFTQESVQLIRKCEYLIQIKLLSLPVYIPMNARGYDTLNEELSFYYMALFHTVKSFTSNLTGSNPTWIKTHNIQNKIEINIFNFLDEFFRYILNAKENFVPLKTVKSCIRISDSQTMDLTESQIDIIITSPPYCTRIDYAISTIIELAIIGLTEQEINTLRNTMLGTPKVICNNLDVENYIFNSITTNSTLKKIKGHNSKAARSYYYKTYFQYFYGMQLSVTQIDRVLRNNGIIIFVVQDSYFKNIHVNLSKCVTEMFEYLNYKVIGTYSYPVSNNMRYINSNSRKYKNTTKTRERVIVLRKVYENE